MIIVEIVLRQDIDKHFRCLFPVCPLQEMVAPEHTALRMVDGDSGESLDVLHGFAGENGQQRTGMNEGQNRVYTVMFHTNIQIYIMPEQD